MSPVTTCHDGTVGSHRAVRFTGDAYIGAVQYSAMFRSADRRLDVDLSIDAARYAPGDSATVNVS